MTLLCGHSHHCGSVAGFLVLLHCMADELDSSIKSLNAKHRDFSADGYCCDYLDALEAGDSRTKIRGKRQVRNRQVDADFRKIGKAWIGVKMLTAVLAIGGPTLGN
jgi:hypothetical protein